MRKVHHGLVWSKTVSKIVKVDIFNDSTFPITTPLSRSGAFLNFEKQASLLGNPVDKIANLFEAKVQYLGK